MKLTLTSLKGPPHQSLVLGKVFAPYIAFLFVCEGAAYPQLECLGCGIPPGIFIAGSEHLRVAPAMQTIYFRLLGNPSESEIVSLGNLNGLNGPLLKRKPAEKVGGEIRPLFHWVLL